ncbi:hypothetical protein PFISCL1PPCAC_13072, partial [Pristionchus fissidentatus]
MADHTAFTVQAAVMYVMTIFALQEFMRGRPAFKLALPFKIWNLSLAVMSGVCAVLMTPEYFDTLINKGYSGRLERRLFLLIKLVLIKNNILKTI